MRVVKKWDNESILKRFSELHDGQYSYPDFNFSGVESRLKIVCPLHGVFDQKVKKHLEGQGCKKCVPLNHKWRNPTGYRDESGKQVQYRLYTIWRSMQQRTKPSYWVKHTHYSGTMCSENFKSWDYFYEWCVKQGNAFYSDLKGKPFELDKDLLSQGSKCYSEDTCIFLPREINLVLRQNPKRLPELYELYKDQLTEVAKKQLETIISHLGDTYK